jgi:pyrroloquinoline-quinone synthase
MNGSGLEPNQFIDSLRTLRTSYHLEHPFQKKMNAGELSPSQIRGWVANRYYYQKMIPRKDAAILARCPDQNARKLWVKRILDHDGTGENAGGIEAWIALGIATGLTREVITSEKMVVPGVRFAVDAYFNFALTAPWQESVCASLTELFASEAHRTRLEAFPKYYPWITAEGLTYFRRRLTECRLDVEHGLEITQGFFRTAEQQQRAHEILKFKLDILWSMLDAIAHEYSE